MIIMKVADDRTVAITGRITLFLFFYSIFLFMLYVQGSLQDFMESSLLGILVLYRYCALIYMVFAVFNIALQALSPPAPRQAFSADRFVVCRSDCKRGPCRRGFFFAFIVGAYGLSCRK